MQTAYICYDPQKLKILEDLFLQSRPQRVIIFSSSKMKVKELASTLKRMKFNVAAMHSDLEQSQREEVMKEFKNGHIDILVATDVVSRGIDINDIKLVVNYDIPHDPEDYVHRIGRTARGTGGEGLAITFISIEEQAQFKRIEDFLEKKFIKFPLTRSSAKPRYTNLKNTETCVADVDVPGKTVAPEEDPSKTNVRELPPETATAAEDHGKNLNILIEMHTN